MSDTDKAAEAKLHEIQRAIQEHSDVIPGPHETVVDFVVVVAAIDDEGVFRYSFLKSSMMSPHGAIGLMAIGETMVQDAMLPDLPDDE